MDRGSRTCEALNQLPATWRRKRNLAEDSSETPAISPNSDLSRCHPIPVPWPYWLMPTCLKSSAARPAKSATLARSPPSQEGNFFGGEHAATRKIIAKAKRRYASASDESVKFKRPKLEPVDHRDQFRFLLVR